MARDFVKIDTASSTATQAGLLRNYIQVLRQAFELGTRVKAVMTHNNDGVNFADIELYFGLPAGKGQFVFDLVNGSTGAMVGTFQNNNCQTITEQVG